MQTTVIKLGLTSSSLSAIFAALKAKYTEATKTRRQLSGITKPVIALSKRGICELMSKRTDYKICEYCGASLDVGERCDCMDRAPKIAGREYKPTRRKDGSIIYFGFPIMREVVANERN